MAKHAILSASGASRWFACPPSARLEQNYENKSSEFAQEGTLAHELGEITLGVELKIITPRKYTAGLKKIREHELYAKEMEEYIETYVDICMEKISAAKAISSDAVVNIEQRLNFSEWVPEGFGTGDLVIVADGTIEIIDLKYGKGVPVSAIGNKQMRLYALGAIAEFQFLYDIEKVRMTIVQPRLDNISTDEILAGELLSWAENELRSRAELAFKGEGEFCAGNHCTFCRAKAVCRARAEKNMELAKYEFAKPPTLTPEEIAEILKDAEALRKWATDIQDYALDQAVNHAVKFPGYKVVEGRSNRKWISDLEEEAGRILLKEGFLEKIIYTKKLTGITNMESAIGKKEVNRLLGDYIEKPPGKPVLVEESDKRPEISSAAEAIKDFGEVKT